MSEVYPNMRYDSGVAGGAGGSLVCTPGCGERPVTVRELILLLQSCDDQDAEVIMYIVAEDDTFRPVSGIAYGEMEPGGRWAHIHQRDTPNAVSCVVILPG